MSRLELALLPGPVTQTPQGPRQLAGLVVGDCLRVLASAAVRAFTFEIFLSIRVRIDERQNPLMETTAREDTTSGRGAV
jgi:hypothetical protein